MYGLGKRPRERNVNGHKILVLNLCVENYQDTVSLGLALDEASAEGSH
jgi:hypothetical protein